MAHSSMRRRPLAALFTGLSLALTLQMAVAAPAGFAVRPAPTPPATGETSSTASPKPTVGPLPMVQPAVPTVVMAAPAVAPTVAVSPTLPPTPTVVPSKPIATVNQVEGDKFPQVVTYVTATDESGAPLQGLIASNFELFEDGLPIRQHEVNTSVNTREPLAVALVLDISGSMEGKPIDYARSAATSFLDVLSPADRVSLISFSTTVKTNVPFTTTKPIIAVGIDNLRAGGDTALFDAMTTAIQALGQLGAGRKVAVLLTDGEDTKSRARLDDVLALVAANRVPIFSVGLGDAIDKKVLDIIAERSGGRTIYAPSAIDLARSYRTLADQLRSQYTISFGSGQRADGKEHSLVVRLKHPLGIAESKGVFVAQQNAPWIDIVTPRAGQVITTSVEAEVSVQAAAAPAKIVRVDFTIDGQPAFSSSAPPYVSTISPRTIPAGPHVMRVTVYDSVGNTASQEISFVTQLPTTPVPVPTPSPSPTPTPAPLPSQPFPILPVISGVSLFLIAGVIAGITVNKRRHRAEYTCLRCGTVYTGRDECPTCALEERHVLLRRLHEVIGDDKPPADQPDAKDHS